MENALLEEVTAKSALTDEQLYLAFISPKDGALFSPEGRIIEGKKRFLSMLATYKPAICGAYHKYSADIPEAVSLAVGIATALSPALATTGLPLVPFCVLAVRHGLRGLCEDEDND